ncbi:hypothetical protein A2230_07530 [candidate division WOR-1 bacterium RIFOXYA2_FULL_36_21]|uniref:SLH domain-containing protein n=1 Tax=candidate division WOR-1 bacterium RIFOXYB2_FULL_36_35 TaxID=1802578 RepID=A0A1F4S2V5_UNCSA|nr:MAG: hypothetical protein A2230_07530 [candidate division WOR-1 bacterium RIFOXYA2_FULL_36_21]OGC14762.1 MAG: hypothetical protein A2290_08715 [candidate division WOR-1 bacterium RIFOXYB2_FULL_36_35]OGC15454.1 MAG: hypothetical protein A2282_07705 [candidate division WOR-1 bacterium RIFOXYA12_FULL_36_13]
MKKIFLTIIITLFLGATANCLTLLELGDQVFDTNLGSRPLSMGGAFVAVANDPNASFYNPGGLPWAKGISLNGKDFNNLSVSQAYPTGFGSTLGIAYIRSNIKNLIIDNNSAGDFSSSVIVFSAGSKLSALPFISKIPNSENIGIGFNFKSILSQITTGTFEITGTIDKITQGWELDAGLLTKTLPWLSFGITAQNIMPKGSNVNNGGVINWNTAGYGAVPAILKSGVSAQIIGPESPINSEQNKLILNTDMQSQQLSQSVTTIGLEWIFNNYLAFRCGIVTKPAPSDTGSFGIGFNTPEWGLDIASYYDFLSSSRAYTFSMLYNPQTWTFKPKSSDNNIKPEGKKASVIKLAVPKEFTTYNENIVVSGEAQNGTIVLINNQPIILDKNNKFEVVLPLSIGKNFIAIEASLNDLKENLDLKILRKAKIKIAEEGKIENDLKSAKTEEAKEFAKKEMTQFKIRKEKLEALITIGVIDVAPQEEFAFDKPISRGEFASWVVKSFNIPLANSTDSNLFSDVPSTYPFAPYIITLVDKKIMSGEGGYFYPEKTITKTEAEKIIKKIKNI